jgi:hypothetical protein
MLPIRRWRAPAVLAAALVAGLAAAPAASAGTAVATITINATSPHYPGLQAKDHGLVDGYAIVIFRAKSKENSATVSGTVTTTATNDIATLLAEPFGATSFSAAGTPIALTPADGVASYSFNVTPSVATQYEVQVSGADTITSSPVTVYFATGGRVASRHVHCGRSRCTYSARFFVFIPAPAYKTESRKHLYVYLAAGRSRLPKDYALDKAAKVSKPKKINSGEWEQTESLSFPAGDFWYTVGCWKDTESKDGVGLPGHHSCGDKHVSRNLIYLG